MLNLTILTRLADNDPHKAEIKKLLKGVAIPNFVPLGDNAQKVCDAIRGADPDMVVFHATTAQRADCLHEQILREIGLPIPPILTVELTDNDLPKKVKDDHQFPTWEQAIKRFPEIVPEPKADAFSKIAEAV